jgi:3-oxoacyl-[acyl-carrier-protein] synthase III
MSRTVDWTDRSICVLFGDGAGAVVLQASEKPGILCSKLHAHGGHKDLLKYPNHMVSRHLKVKPVSNYMQMKGNEVFKVAVRSLEEVVQEILDDQKIAKEDIQWLVPHQANLRIISALAKKLDMSLERVILTIEEHGNTSSASIPLALDQGVRDGRIKRGDNILLESFGGGMAWGAALVNY